MKITNVSLVMLILLSVVFNNIALSWDNGTTHMQLSEYAAKNSMLDKNKGDYLKNLGFDDALNTEFKWGIERSVIKWLANGAFVEDAGNYLDGIRGTARYSNHFHDPTKEWNNAGLTNLQFASGTSALLWAQDSDKQAGSIEEDWSWQKVRQVYYWALTATTDAERQVNFAQTFRGLGHQMHLIQDMAQPDHVRNDAHPVDATDTLGTGLLPDGLETWTKNNISNLSTMETFAASATIPHLDLNVDISYDGKNYTPITQFIDTGQYKNSLNPSTSDTWGLAEYTNANFVSDDTVFTEDIHPDYDHYFPYPRYSSESYEMYEIELPFLRKRIYLRKIGDGERVEHFATVGPLFKYLDFDPALQKDELKLDDPTVHQDYAEKLIPRAVGYSAGLLNYFFRGDIDMIPDEETGSGYVIVNNTEENMVGTFELYYDDQNSNRQLVQGATWNLTLGTLSSNNNVSGNITFTPPGDASAYMLVFRGRLGNEDGAVVGQWLPACGAYTTAIFVASPKLGSGAEYDNATVSAYIDPAKTNWIAWNDAPLVQLTRSSRPGEIFLGPGSNGVDDYINLTVIAPSGASQTINIDWNNASGTSSGIQNVIFGTSAEAPDVFRQNPPYASPPNVEYFFDEAGSHNSIFSEIGSYEFQFSFRNEYTEFGSHTNIYLLINQCAY